MAMGLAVTPASADSQVARIDPRFDKWTTQDGSVSCKYTADGQGVTGRGSLYCYVAKSNLMVRWWKSSFPTVRQATALERARFRNFPKAPSGRVIGMGPRRAWPKYPPTSSAYQCWTRSTRDAACAMNYYHTDGLVGVSFTSGVVRLFAEAAFEGREWKWSSGRWRCRTWSRDVNTGRITWGLCTS